MIAVDRRRQSADVRRPERCILAGFFNLEPRAVARADVDFRERPDPEVVAATVVFAFGSACSDHDLMVFLEAAGLPAPDPIIGDPAWVKWRCGRAAGVPACGAARTMDE
ncbi:hypothetical protein [Streptomyces xantholiticus]|uniref:hypothetical protein n=1 Tax=Streptomyces xantholiticus TaxID=68285 RepID=UPI001E47654F|nr:hypothetical protein [Streptomyces xantholiticus]